LPGRIVTKITAIAGTGKTSGRPSNAERLPQVLHLRCQVSHDAFQAGNL
jgi:hypothetical protein